MKKVLSLNCAILMLSNISACEEGSTKPISFSDLPEGAQTCVNTYFHSVQVSLVTRDNEAFDKSYDVIFDDGRKVEFDKSGEWKSVDCGRTAVPAGIVPAEIASYVNRKHPENIILEIERDRNHYELQLDNDIELKFDMHFRLIGYDD